MCLLLCCGDGADAHADAILPTHRSQTARSRLSHLQQTSTEGTPAWRRPDGHTTPTCASTEGGVRGARGQWECGADVV